MLSSFLVGPVCRLAVLLPCCGLTVLAAPVPVIHDVDVVVIGGSGGAVAAAEAAARSGAKVFLAARRSYLGDDIAGTLQLWDDGQENPQGALSRRLFGDRRKELSCTNSIQDTKGCVTGEGTGRPLSDGTPLAAGPRGELTPLNVKKVLDQALVDSGALFMTGCYGTGLLVDSQGNVSGVVIANRSGRQAVKAKVVIDATPFGMLARQAGARFSSFVPGPVKVSTVVISGSIPQAPGLSVRTVMQPRTVTIGGRWGVKPADGFPDTIPVSGFHGEATLQLAEFTPFALSELEHQMRDLVFTHAQQDVAEMVRFAPPFRLQGEDSVAIWPSCGMPDPGASRPRGIPGIYVLSGVADYSPEAALSLVVPANLMNVGECVGQAAAAEALRRPAPEGVCVLGAGGAGSAAYGDVRELLGGLMPNATTSTGTVPEGDFALPVLGSCDVLVAGGGSSGSPAAIAAARHGMNTVLCEYHHDLGGVATVGVLGKYYHGRHAGFTAEMEEPIRKLAANINQGKAEWFRRTARRHGVRILTGTLACGVTVREGRVTGVVVATPDGQRGVILATVVIDATGNADLAAAAGEPTDFISSSELAIQGASLNDRPLASNTINVDIGFVDDTDAWDMSFFPLRLRQTLGFNSVWDQSQHVDSRERRRIVGEYTVTPVDVFNERTFPDTIVQGCAPFDNHGQTTAPALSLFRPVPVELELNYPYRAILPRTLDGLLVVGLGMSADHDAIPALRMQRDLQNLGYAAGVAASLSIKSGSTPRGLDVRKLQALLVEARIIQPDVPGSGDNFPLPRKDLEEAVRMIPERGGDNQAGYRGLLKLCTDPATAVPLLKEALASATNSNARAMYAASLALFGDRTGVPVLIETLNAAPDWDAGWQWSGSEPYARKHSYLDGYVHMLGHVKAIEAVPAILVMADKLTETSGYSHFRAVAMALEQMGDARAVPALSRLIALPGVSGNSMEPFSKRAVVPYASHSAGSGDLERRAVLRELGLARALYRLGDDHGKGEAILKAYAADPRSAYARHALMVLAAGLGPRP